MDNRQEVKSLKKALRVLAFLNIRGESTVTHVAQAVGIPRTTSHRLLETLAAEGYIEKQPHCDLYRLTSQVQELSKGFGKVEMAIEIARPLVEDFGRKVRWPVALATPRGCDMVVRVATDHETPLAIDRYTIGFATPILYAPSGFCYLAYCDTEETDAILAQSVHSTATAMALGNGEYLSFMLNHVRTKGFCNINFPEYREGGVAVPLFADQEIVGALVMRYMKSNLKTAQIHAEFVPALRKLADEIDEAFRVKWRSRPVAVPQLYSNG